MEVLYYKANRSARRRSRVEFANGVGYCAVGGDEAGRKTILLRPRKRPVKEIEDEKEVEIVDD
jgi:hypothetical protein